MFMKRVKNYIDLRLSEIKLDALKTLSNILEREGQLINLVRAAVQYNDPDKLEIKIKYFEPGLDRVEKIAVGDWIDLRAADTVTLAPGEYRLLRLGVGMILPDGYEAHVLPRSSTANKFGIILANSMGVIDNSYSGDNDEWMFPAVAIRETTIHKGDRIAQFRVVKNQPRICFEFVDQLNEVSRGGIGSTGER